MRIRHAAATPLVVSTLLVAGALVAGGCSVDVGAGTIEPLTVDEPIDPTQAIPPLSLDLELPFLTAEQSQSIEDQYGSKLGAVDHIDIEVQAIGIVDGTGATVPGSSFVVAFEGVTIAHAGDRLHLPDATKKKLLEAVKKGTDLVVPMRVLLVWPDSPPADMMAHAVLQPVVVVNALKAL
jgi:hypothetical protein